MNRHPTSYIQYGSIPIRDSSQPTHPPPNLHPLPPTLLPKRIMETAGGNRAIKELSGPPGPPISAYQ